MSPEEKRQFDELKQQVSELARHNSSIDRFADITDNIFINNKDVDDDQVTTTINVVGGEGGTVDALDFPDRWVVLRYKGQPYLTPLYSYTRLGT